MCVRHRDVSAMSFLFKSAARFLTSGERSLELQNGLLASYRHNEKVSELIKLLRKFMRYQCLANITTIGAQCGASKVRKNFANPNIL